MLVIREQQIQSFIADSDDRLVELIAQTVREMNPDRIADLDEAQLTRSVIFGVERARSHGLRRSETIAAFVAVMFEIAPNFDEQPQIKNALADANYPPDERFDLLWQRTSDDDWIEAVSLYDAEIWFPGK
jgi:hypothetical protein